MYTYRQTWVRKKYYIQDIYHEKIILLQIQDTLELLCIANTRYQILYPYTCSKKLSQYKIQDTR